MSYENHAWRHRFKFEGGTDPLLFALPWCYGDNDGSGFTVSADMELPFNTARVKTNDGDTFKFDDSDNEALLICRPGFYFFWSRVVVNATTTAREIYAAVQPRSSGPLAGLGNAVSETGAGGVSLGNGQGDHSLGAVVTTAKSLLAFQGAQRVIGATSTDPWRAVTMLNHPVGDWSVASGLTSGMLIVRLGDNGAKPPAP